MNEKVVIGIVVIIVAFSVVGGVLYLAKDKGAIPDIVRDIIPKGDGYRVLPMSDDRADPGKAEDQNKEHATEDNAAIDDLGVVGEPGQPDQPIADDHTSTNYASVVVDTNQTRCYSNISEISCPSAGGSFYGQDAQYSNNQPSYRDNGNNTVTDLNTGLMWTKGYYGKLSFDEGPAYARSLTVGGYSDWRVPSIKELYSLMDFSGTTGSGNQDSSVVPSDAVPYMNTDYFEFAYGGGNERYIDSQWLTTAKYVSVTMHGDQTMFGVNFADGRIKGYGYFNPNNPRINKTFYARFVRGNVYGENSFVNNGNDTVTDNSTGLMWMKKDNGHYGVGGLNWQEALDYCEDLSLVNYTDWRLPNAKELQYIVDYTRSPDTTNSAAINPIFDVTKITAEDGKDNFPFYWTGTTHLEGRESASGAVYIAFGEAFGYMNNEWLDVHGAGAQRSDPKTGNPASYPIGHGPQGDAIRIYNYVRCVR